MSAHPTTPRESAPQADKTALALGCVEVLGRLAGLFTERRKQLAEGAGLTDQQWQVLETIQSEHFMPSLFAQQRDSSAAAVSKILRQLTDKELISVRVSRQDGRKRRYSVTSRGKAVLDSLRGERRAAVERVWLDLSEADLVSFFNVGGKLASRLDALAAESRLRAGSSVTSPLPCSGNQESKE